MDKIAISRLSVCPIRQKPIDGGEMISQLLFGERVEILEKYKKNWVRIRCLHDDYEGWMDSKQLQVWDEELKRIFLCLDLTQPTFAEQYSTYITMGAELPFYDGITATIDKVQYRFSGQAISVEELSPNTENIERLARKMLNAPYLWGGRSPFGIDCSGFTQVVFKCSGIQLKRDSVDQAGQGEPIDFIGQSRTGDLAFFTKDSAHITHVGIVLGPSSIIHASGKVRIDTLDHYGIFDSDIQEYTHRLKIIKRYF